MCKCIWNCVHVTYLSQSLTLRVDFCVRFRASDWRDETCGYTCVSCDLSAKWCNEWGLWIHHTLPPYYFYSGAELPWVPRGEKKREAYNSYNNSFEIFNASMAVFWNTVHHSAKWKSLESFPALIHLKKKKERWYILGFPCSEYISRSVCFVHERDSSSCSTEQGKSKRFSIPIQSLGKHALHWVTFMLPTLLWSTLLSVWTE